MKILTVIYGLGKGGTERAAQVFSEAYKEIGHDSRLLALYELGPRYEEIRKDIKVWFQLTDSNTEAILSWRPDIIHIHSHGPKKSDIDKLVSLVGRDSKIIETNVFSSPSPWCESVDISLQLSDWAHWLFNLRGGKELKSSVVPYPVKCSNFSRSDKESIDLFKEEHGIPTKAIVIGRVGQSIDSKWSPKLIEVFNELSSENLNLYLLLINPPKIVLEYIEKSSFKKRIIIIPNVLGDNSLSLVYSTIDIMIHVSDLGESFGMVLAEALLCEVPVVTLSTPWVDNSQCQVVGNAIGGFVVNSKTGLKQASKVLIEDRKMAQTLGKSGRQHIIINYNYIQVAEMALRSLSVSSKGNQKSEHRRVIELLNDTFDRPTFLTRLFVVFNSDFFRILTKYTSKNGTLSQLLNAIYSRLTLRS